MRILETCQVYQVELRRVNSYDEACETRCDWTITPSRQICDPRYKPRANVFIIAALLVSFVSISSKEAMDEVSGINFRRVSGRSTVWIWRKRLSDLSRKTLGPRWQPSSGTENTFRRRSAREAVSTTTATPLLLFTGVSFYAFKSLSQITFIGLCFCFPRFGRFRRSKYRRTKGERAYPRQPVLRGVSPPSRVCVWPPKRATFQTLFFGGKMFQLNAKKRESMIEVSLF